MKDYIEERVLEIANYMIQSKATVREIAKIFKVSKSTVHKDVSERLPKINPIMWEEVKKVLEHNKAERHIRGGKATRLKYKKMKEQNQKNIKNKEDFWEKSRIF